MMMADLENLKDSQDVQISSEFLTDEQAKDVIFSPESFGSAVKRNEYFRSIIKNIDIDKLKDFIEQTDIDISSFRNTLINYGFTEDEIEKSGEYLNELKYNPDILESYIENEEMIPPIIPIIIIILLSFGLGIGVGYLIRGRKNKVEENMYVEAGTWETPAEVLKLITAEQKFHDVAGHATMRSEKDVFYIFNVSQKKEVYLMIDGKISASFDGEDFLKNCEITATSDGAGHIKVNVEVPKPNLMISDISIHDVYTEDNLGNRIFPNKDLDKAHEDAYNKAIQSIIQNKETSNDFYEFARKSLESKMEFLYATALDMAGKKYESIDVNVRYTNDKGHIYYNKDNMHFSR